MNWQLSTWPLLILSVLCCSQTPGEKALKVIPTDSLSLWQQRFLEGGRIDVNNQSIYNGAYCSGGYPPEGVGVCTDVIWRAYKNCGVYIKDSIDLDIKKHPNLYQLTNNKADPNIDFRRVKTYLVYLKRHAKELDKNIENNYSHLKPGDILCFDKPDHIAIVSDKKTGNTPWIIHNQGPVAAEANHLGIWEKHCTGCFRLR
jgi:hypothetical protein